MSVWTTVLLASGLAFALKYLGYVVPHQMLDGAAVSRVTAMLPVALLSALVAVQTFTTSGGGLTLDARAAGVAVAVSALLLRAPFLVVVILAAATSATLRAFGWG
jgi:branched-subunit amino acid transport protein